MSVVHTLFQLPFLPSAWSILQKGNALLTIGFLLITLMLFLFILLSRLRDGFRFANKQRVTKVSQEFITSYMFNEEMEDYEVARFRKKYLANGTQRQIFMDALLQLQKNIVGELAERLCLLYMQMGLHADSKRKLYAGSWNVIAKGINELAEMDMQQDVDLIRSFINHPNQEMRLVAHVAVLRLQRDNPFSFLDELQVPILEWEQMQLANAAHRSHMHMPAFKQWVTKKEPSIVIFCIRMIDFYNQHDAESELIGMLCHPAKEVKLEAIKAVCSLEAYSAKDRLMELYEQETTDVKLEILKALAVIGGNDIRPFYKKVMASPERRLQIEAAKALVNYSGPEVELLQSLPDSADSQMQYLAAVS